MALLSAKALASELGFTVKQIRRLAHAGKIPCEKYGSEYRFDVAQVRAAATYVNPIKADAHQAARRAWMRPIRRAR